MFDGYNHTVFAEAASLSSVEMFKLEEQKSNLVLSEELNFIDAVRDISETSQYLLHSASESYGISSNIKDYILSPVISMPSDLPNKNNHTFPLSTLTEWNVDAAQVMYKTWIGRPVHVEHRNSDHTIAKGIILDCVLKPILGSDGNIWKVVKLAAVDRTRDPVLANDILSNSSSSWSMGAKAQDFACSICGTLDSKGGCEHVHKSDPRYKLFGGRLATNLVLSAIGFELSNVKKPAFESARDMPYYLWA